MRTSPLYPRRLESRIEEAMADTPVVLLAGPRQAGKTTLVRQMSGVGMRYLTLDDELTLMSARDDPVGMIRSLDRAVIDEIQRAPQLLLAIKKSVDEDRRPGRFLLTGSANVMATPKVADSLAGRMETLLLLPLSQGEIEGQTANWLDGVFAGQIPKLGTVASGNDLVERVLKGGYPEVIARATARRRNTWLASTSMRSFNVTCAIFLVSKNWITCPVFCVLWRRHLARCAITRNWEDRLV